MDVNSSIICIGELLIDFFCTDVDINLMEGRNFQKQAGGAPANVCCYDCEARRYCSILWKSWERSVWYFLKKTLDDVSGYVNGCHR